MEPLPLTESLALRPVSSHDLDDLLALVEREQAHLARWMPWAEAPQRRGTAEFLEAAEAQLARGDGAHFAITDDERIVGVVGFHGIDWRNLSTSIGYWLAAAEQGSGVMTLAVGALLAHAFDERRLHRVEIRAAVANTRSRAIPERLGFSLEGINREAERFSDHFKDQAVYALLAPEWRDARP